MGADVLIEKILIENVLIENIQFIETYSSKRPLLDFVFI